jgi:hypothetical protein
MNIERMADCCRICGALLRDDSGFCTECEKAFEPVFSNESGGEQPVLDLELYCYRMFPWERSRNLPGLITSKMAWAFLAIVLVSVVLWLALARAPLPSCWEISEITVFR